MAMKKMKDLKNLSADELNGQIRELEANQFKARMQKETGQLKDGATLWRVRKELARLKTLVSKKAQPKAAKAAKAEGKR